MRRRQRLLQGCGADSVKTCLHRRAEDHLSTSTLEGTQRVFSRGCECAENFKQPVWWLMRTQEAGQRGMWTWDVGAE